MQSSKGILKAKRSSWWVKEAHNIHLCGFSLTFYLLSQDEVGVETDEDCKVVVPSTWKNKSSTLCKECRLNVRSIWATAVSLFDYLFINWKLHGDGYMTMIWKGLFPPLLCIVSSVGSTATLLNVEDRHCVEVPFDFFFFYTTEVAHILKIQIPYRFISWRDGGPLPSYSCLVLLSCYTHFTLGK